METKHIVKAVTMVVVNQLTLVEKPLSQTLHLKGLSLVCDLMWISRAELQAKTLKQI